MSHSNLLLLFLTILITTHSIYVNENNNNTSPDGSRDNPYPTLQDAINNFTHDDSEIILLGDSITLNETVTLPSNTDCTIRPDTTEETEYFPLYFAPGAAVISIESNLTVQNLEIIELDKHRDTLTNAFQQVKGVLTFNKIYMSDIDYSGPGNSYMLIYAGEETVAEAEVRLIDCHFENFINVQIFVQQAKVFMNGCYFDNITMKVGAFITLYANTFWYSNLTALNTTVVNSKFDYPDSNFFSGFIEVTQGTVSGYIDGLTAKNITLVNSVPLVWHVSLFEDENNPTTYTILNVVVEDIFEIPDPQAINGVQNTGVGLIFDISGTTSLNVTNLTANNLQFEYDSLLRYSPEKTYFLYVYKLLPSVHISNLKITDSANANFLIFGIDSGQVENVELISTYCITTDIVFPIFYFENADSVSIKNVRGTDVYGPLLKLNQVFYQVVQNVTFYNYSTSQAFAKENQNIMQSIRDPSSLNLGLNTDTNMTTVISDFNVYGFKALDASSNQADSNDTYMIVAVTELGVTYIQDCYWYNIQMGSFLSTSINILTINNLTVDADPTLPAARLPWHRVFQMVNINMLRMSNSRFLNNQNVVIFNFFNIKRSELYNSVDVINLAFDNITLSNNYANYWSSDTLYLSQFLLNSPLKPYQVTFNNSYFSGNKISNGLISTLESYRVEVTIQNCIFENNYGQAGGAAFAAQTMQDNQNTFSLINNTFRNNWVSNNGGVFSFVNTWFIVYAQNNTYLRNNASSNGGVGYILSTKLTFFESNAIYLNSFAGKLGGTWYLSTSNQEDSDGLVRPISFINTTIQNSKAGQSGGAIYIALGNLRVSQCLFQNNTASISGGDFFMVTFSSFSASNSNFSKSYAPQGAFLHADSLYGEIVSISNSRIENFASTLPTMNLIELNSGWIYISNTTFYNINMPLFKLEATSAKLQNVTISHVTCTSSSTFCIIQGTAMALDVSKTTITDVVSNSDLIVLHSPLSNTTINQMEVNGVTTFLTSSKNSLKQLLALRLYSAQQVMLQNSGFYNFINFSSIIVEKSFFEVSGSSFSNKGSGRLLLGLEAELKTDIETETETEDDSSGTAAGGFSQFMVLTTSNVTISTSSFAYNSGVPQTDGGAIRILGDSSTTGSYKIMNSSFRGNQGYQGGAISVQGPFNSLNIENSNFTSNIADTNGGSIYFANQSVRLVPKIQNSIFKYNQAHSGGAIFVGNQPLYIQNSTFDSNSARDGGAIASFSESSQIVTLSQNLFEDNSAYVGAALRALGTTNFDTASSKFVDNTAEIGGVLATNPTQLRLVIYEVEDYFLFLEESDLDPEYMIAHSGTVIVYDSQKASSNDTLEQKSGRNPSYLFEFSFLDQLGENLPIIEKANIQISVKNFIVPRGSVTPGLLGQTVYQFNDTTGYIFNSFSVRGNQTSTVTLTAQGSFDNTFINQVEQLTPLDWKVTIGPCSIGEYYDDVNLLCTPCSTGTYSLSDPYQTLACLECPDDMTCLGGDIYFPVAGYWRISNTSDNVVQCFNNQACLGGQQDSGRDVSLTGFCRPGYNGIACGSCDPGYAKFGTSQKCVNCSTNAGYYIRFIAYLFILIVVIIFATRAVLDDLDPNYEDAKSAIMKATLIKIVIDFVQILNLASEFDFHWPAEIEDFLDAITKITPTNKDALSVDCFVALIKGDNYDLFFIKLLLLNLQPLFYMMVASIVWMVIFRIAKKQVLHNPELRKKILITGIVIIYILQPGIVKSTFQLFNCANFGSTSDPQYYLIEDTNIECWEPKHVTWTLALGIPSLIIWLIIPSVWLLYVVIRKKFTKSETWAQQHQLVFDRYREKTFYWEVLILLRKVLIIIFTVFLTYTYLQAYLSFFTLVIAYSIEAFIKPFIYPALNSAEKLSLFAANFILYTALFFVRTDGNDDLVPLFLTLDVLIGVFFFVYCLVIAFRALKGRIARIKKRFKKLCGLDGAKKPNFVGRTIRRLLPEKPKNGEDLIVLHKDHITDTETDSLNKETESNEKTLKIGKIQPQRSSSAEYPEDSTSHFDPRLRSMKSLDGDVKLFSVRNTETDLLNSYRASINLSPNRRVSIRLQPILPSQILDLDDDRNHTRAGSMPEIAFKENIGLDIVLEEAPTATLNKDTLKDNRFKDFDKVEIGDQNSRVFEVEEDQKGEGGEYGLEDVLAENPVAKLKIEMLKDDRFKDFDKVKIDDNVVTSSVLDIQERNKRDQGEFRLGDHDYEEDQPVGLQKELLKDERFKDLEKIQFEDEEEKGVVRKITMFTEEGDDNEEMVPLSALKDDDFRNSLDTNSLDDEIQKEEFEKSLPVAKNELSLDASKPHEVLSLSAIDPIQSYTHDDGEILNPEGNLMTEISHTRNESSEDPDIMTLSAVIGRHEGNEPHSAA